MHGDRHTPLAEAILADLLSKKVQPKMIAFNHNVSGAYVCQIGCRNNIHFRNPRKKHDRNPSNH